MAWASSYPSCQLKSPFPFENYLCLTGRVDRAKLIVLAAHARAYGAAHKDESLHIFVCKVTSAHHFFGITLSPAGITIFCASGRLAV